MDAFASYREKLRVEKKRQGKTISINWPLWAEGGLKIDDATLQWMKQTLDAHPLATQDGIEAFLTALTQDNQTIVLFGQKQKLESALQYTNVPNERKSVEERSSCSSESERIARKK